MANQNTAAVQFGDKQPIDVKMTYGATELKKLYQKYTSIGLIVAVIIFATAAVASLAAYIAQQRKLAEQEQNAPPPRIVNVDELPETPPMTNDEPPPPDVDIPEKIVPLKDLTALVPEPVKKTEAQDVVLKTQTQLENMKTENVASTGDENATNQTYRGPISVQEKKVEQKIEQKEEKKVEQKKDIFTTAEVEKAPSPVNLGSVRPKYPEIARSSGIEGRVVAKVLVGTDGSVIRVGGMSGPDVFHSAVRDVINDLRFTPALQNGQAVKCWVSVPFNFKLSGGFK